MSADKIKEIQDRLLNAKSSCVLTIREYYNKTVPNEQYVEDTEFLLSEIAKRDKAIKKLKEQRDDYLAETYGDYWMGQK